MDPTAIVTGLLPPGTAFGAEQTEELLDRVSRETPGTPPERRAPKAAAPEPALKVVRNTPASAGRVVEERLPSGARVLVREEPAVPLFAIRAAFPGGLRYETAETNGLTTLLGRCLTRGTPSHALRASLPVSR